jgi:two-component system, NarL family, sensor kinase
MSNNCTLSFWRLFFIWCVCIIPQLASGRDIKQEIDSLNKLSFQLIKDFPDSASQLARRAIALSESARYFHGLGDGYMRLGIIEKDYGNYQAALEHYKTSLHYRSQIGDKDLIARVYNNIGTVYSLRSMYDSAAYFLTSALALAESLNLTSAQAMYSMNLGIAYEKNRDFDLALKYIGEGKHHYNSIGDSTGVLKCMINEANVYHAQQSFEKALNLYREALAVATATGDERSRHIIIGDLAVTFMNLNHYDSAIHYFRSSLPQNVSNENIRGQAIDMSNLGMLFVKMNLNDSAKYYLKESLWRAEQIGELALASGNAHELAVLYRRAGDYEKAFAYQEKFILYHDSVFNKSKAESIAELQTRYETEKKEREIIILGKDAELRKQQLSRKTLIQYFLIAGLAGVVIISGLGFNWYKLRKKIEKQQALLDERKRISSELHDDLGAQLSTARMFLATMAAEENGTRDRSILADSISLIEGSISDLRKIMDDLHSSALREQGIIAATEELVNKINNLQKIEFRLSHHGFEKRPDLKTEHQLFRIVQELINNTIKYANARNVSLDFIIRDGTVILLYEDDGVGFELANVIRGYGLSNIQSRALSMGGTAEFDSAPGQGSRTIIELPLNYA